MKKLSFGSALVAGSLILGISAFAQDVSTPSTQQPSGSQAQTASPTNNPGAQTPSAPSEAPTTPSMKQSPDQNPTATQASPAETPSQVPSSQAPDASQSSGSAASGSTNSTAASPTSAGSAGMQAQSFSGTIEQSNGKLCLKDASGRSYQLDDQQKAQKYSGQGVTINGTLDSSSNTIHVEDINPSNRPQ